MAARKSSKSPKSKAKSKRGGRRPGAGRKTKAANKLRADLIAEADKLIVDHLPRLVGNLIRLADGGYQRVEEKWEPEPFAGIDPLTGLRREAPELVLAERKVSVAEPDRAANQYLIDRVLGKAPQRLEHDFGKLSDEELLARIAGAVGRGGEAGSKAADGGA